MFTIDVDTGGTFTDCFVSSDGRSFWVKADTTPHDLTEGFINSINEAARVVGLDGARSLLKQTEIVRLSTTIATNTLIQESGIKVGLIVTRGFEDSVYSEEGDENPIFDTILPEDMVIGIKSRVDDDGRIAETDEAAEIKTGIKELLVHGARHIVISLKNAHLNPQVERDVRTHIYNAYPPQYVGFVPVLLSSEVSLTRDDMLRTNAAVLEAYIRRQMVRFLYKADEDLSKLAFRRPLLVVHNWGGAARVAKTKGVNTVDSGPAAGLYGAAYVADLYKMPCLVSMDVGGTSADYGVILGGEPPVTSSEKEIAGVPIKLPMLQTISIGAGGGSIASVENQELKVGPESAGAMPGPVCYALGGVEPATTDAFVVLGYINPENFLGGRRKLDVSKAREAIEKRVARPLGIAVEEAASRIVEKAVFFCGDFLKDMLKEKGLKAEEVTLLSVGGAGGLFCNGVANAAGINKILVPPFGTAFSAFGSSTIDLVHEYESPLSLELRDPSGSKYLSDFDALNRAIDRMEKALKVDMQGEGFSSEKIGFMLELELRCPDPLYTASVVSNKLGFSSTEDLKVICDEFSEDGAEGRIVLDAVRLKATCDTPHAKLPTFPEEGADPGSSYKGKRKVWWEKGFVDTAVYEKEALKNGNEVKGPAIVEGKATTIPIPEGKVYRIDKYLFGMIEEA